GVAVTHILLGFDGCLFSHFHLGGRRSRVELSGNESIVQLADSKRDLFLKMLQVGLSPTLLGSGGSSALVNAKQLRKRLNGLGANQDVVAIALRDVQFLCGKASQTGERSER